MLDGERLIEPPIIPDLDLIHFNVLFAHLFRTLTESQAMSHLQINTAKDNTITALLDRTFPPIAASDNKPTNYVTPKTVGYIHALMIDCISTNYSESPHARALRNEHIAVTELEKLTPAVFRSELSACLVAYYEGVLKMEGSSGIPTAKIYSRKIKTSVAEAVPQLAPSSLGNVDGVV